MATTATSRRPSRPRAVPKAKDRAAPEAQDGDTAAVPVSGVVDARGNQAFIRTNGYRRGQDDVSVPATCLREYGLRTGDHVEGAARPGRLCAAGRRARTRNGTPAGPWTASMRSTG